MIGYVCYFSDEKAFNLFEIDGDNAFGTTKYGVRLNNSAANMKDGML